MAASRTIKVSNLSSTTTKESLSAFVGFCGAIESIEVAGTTATVVFARDSAAKTAALLNGGHLDGSQLVITTSGDAESADKESGEVTHDGHIDQEHKPRSAVAAEMLAHGYVLSDQSLQKAIELDQKYGISSRFLNFFNPLRDQTIAKSQELDQQHQISTKVTNLATQADAKTHASETASKALRIGKQYYESALKSPFGSKVYDFYTASSRTAQEIHEEAKRIADSKKPATANTSGVSSQPTAAAAATPATAGLGDGSAATAMDASVKTSTVTPNV